MPFDVIDDATLEREDLRRYQVILLPNVACMSVRTVARLQEYVRGGGGLFASFESSLYDDCGIRRDDFALAELFGVKSAGKIVGPKKWDFMQARGSGGALLEGLRRELIPVSAYHVQVRLVAGRALLQFTQPLKGVYDGVPEPSEDPALVVNEFGQGKALYYAGDLGQGINTFHLPDLLRLVANVVGELAPSPVRLQNAPGSVEVVLRSQQGGRRLLLHLVNSTGEMTRPIQHVVPLRDVGVTLAAPRGVTTARTLVRPQKLSLAKEPGGGVRFTLEQVDEYEVVVIE